MADIAIFKTTFNQIDVRLEKDSVCPTRAQPARDLTNPALH
jgi:hypothetical protein